MYQHYKPNKPIKEGPLSFVLFEFLSVSTVSRGYTSLVFLVDTEKEYCEKSVIFSGKRKEKVAERWVRVES